MSCKESTSHSPHGSASDAEPSLEFKTEEFENQISAELPLATQPVPTSISTPESITDTTEFKEPSLVSKEEKEGMLSLLLIRFCLNKQNNVLIAPHNHSNHTFRGKSTYFILFFISAYVYLFSWLGSLL